MAQTTKKKAKAMFPDLFFKLSVLSALMEEGHFVKEAKALQAAHRAKAKDYQPIKEVMAFYESIEIPPKLLATVKTLQPDGGDLAYLYGVNVWDGEDDIFDITSIEGIENLVNLEELSPISMITSKGIDYSPLLGCKKLTRVDAAWADKSKASKDAIRELKARGVEVE